MLASLIHINGPDNQGSISYPLNYIWLAEGNRMQRVSLERFNDLSLTWRDECQSRSLFLTRRRQTAKLCWFDLNLTQLCEMYTLSCQSWISEWRNNDKSQRNRVTDVPLFFFSGPRWGCSCQTIARSVLQMVWMLLTTMLSLHSDLLHRCPPHPEECLWGIIWSINCCYCGKQAPGWSLKSLLCQTRLSVTFSAVRGGDQKQDWKSHSETWLK